MADKFTIILERDGKRYQLEEVEKKNGVYPSNLCKGCVFMLYMTTDRCPRNRHGVWLCSNRTYGKNSHGIWKEVKE